MANKRLIDANALMESKWWDSLKDDFDKARAKIIVQSCPTVDAVEVVHGKWNIINFYSGDTAICSVCGWEMLVNEPGNGLHNVEDLHYCPHCGARMDFTKEDG